MAKIKYSNSDSEGEDNRNQLRKVKTIKRSKSDLCNLRLPVSRVRNYLKRGRYAKRIQIGSAVYLTAILEYLCCEILELSGNIAKLTKKERITPRFITLAIRNDPELNELLHNVSISEGGVVPHIEEVLLKNLWPKKVRK